MAALILFDHITCTDALENHNELEICRIDLKLNTILMSV